MRSVSQPEVGSCFSCLAGSSDKMEVTKSPGLHLCLTKICSEISLSANSKLLFVTEIHLEKNWMDMHR